MTRVFDLDDFEWENTRPQSAAADDRLSSHKDYKND